MPAADIGGLIALNGIAAQLTALSVIVLAFILLCRIAPREDVALLWTAAWAFALIGMSALFVRFLLLPDLDHLQLQSDSPASNLLDATYQTGKLFYGALLLLGALRLRGIRPPPWTVASALLFLFAYAGLSAFFTTDPHGLIHWQIPLAVPLLAATALVLMPGVGPRHERMAGTGPAALVAAGLALFWLTYILAFSRTLGADPIGDALMGVLRFSSYLDMFGHLALAFALAHVVSRGIQERLVHLHRELEATHDRLRHAVRFDELTAVYNRRAFEELASDRGWADAAPVAIAMLDMDNLKEINDERGHAAGDAALAHLAAHISATLDHVVVFRWGGDEFLCVCTRHSSGQLRDRIERALSTLGPVPGLSGMRVEVSVGSVQRSPDESLSRAIDRADRAMYEQKFRRRERALEQHSLFSDAD